MRRPFRPSATVLSLALALAGCAGDPDIDANERAQREELAAARWELVEMDGVPLAALEGGPIDLYLEADGRLHGNAGVNRFSGPWRSTRAGELRIGSLATTRRLGPPEAMQREKRFLDLLARIEACELSSMRLVLRDREGAGALVLESRLRRD
jgi:heat shock protein HslJ